MGSEMCIRDRWYTKSSAFEQAFTIVSRENKNNAYAKFCRTNKEYYVIFESGILDIDTITYFLRQLANLSIETKCDLHVLKTTKIAI